MNNENIQKAAASLYKGLITATTIKPLTETYPDITIDDAYAVSRELLKRRLASGEKSIGKKIGVTSQVVMDFLNVDQPDFGFLTDTMLADQSVIDLSLMIQPRAEAEIAVKLSEPLKGPGVTPADVKRAILSVAACFEIVDSRIENWNIKIQDTIADNASCGTIIVSKDWVNPDNVDLENCQVAVEKNGEFLSNGVGSATLGSPLNAVAWLANTLGARGISLEPGEIILTGSLVPLEPVAPGDKMVCAIEGIGVCQVRFI